MRDIQLFQPGKVRQGQLRQPGQGTEIGDRRMLDPKLVQVREARQQSDVGNSRMPDRQLHKRFDGGERRRVADRLADK